MRSLSIHNASIPNRVHPVTIITQAIASTVPPSFRPPLTTTAFEQRLSNRCATKWPQNNMGEHIDDLRNYSSWPGKHSQRNDENRIELNTGCYPVRYTTNDQLILVVSPKNPNGSGYLALNAGFRNEERDGLIQPSIRRTTTPGGPQSIRIMRSTLTLSRSRLISFRGHDTGEVRRCDQ
jgi:hypothetical protein